MKLRFALVGMNIDLSQGRLRLGLRLGPGPTTIKYLIFGVGEDRGMS